MLYTRNIYLLVYVIYTEYLFIYYEYYIYIVYYMTPAASYQVEFRDNFRWYLRALS